MARQMFGGQCTFFSLPIRSHLPLRSPQPKPPELYARQSNPFSTNAIRLASHQTQGRANGVKDGRGKRLGAKKTGGELVVPGNIIFRQRGTKWHPGENVDIGRDHTIFASEKGYVQYYRDPLRHPKRRYIGVALERTQTLPTPLNAPRRRRLNMIAVPFKEDKVPGADEPVVASRPVGRSKDGTKLKMRSNYMFKEANWEIGLAGDKAKVKPFKKNDRWLAWKKRSAKIEHVKALQAAQRQTRARKAANKAKGKAMARQKGLEFQSKKASTQAKGGLKK